MIRTKRIWMIWMLLAILVMTACGTPKVAENVNHEESVAARGEVVAVVNGENLYMRSFEQIMDRMVLMYQQQGINMEGEDGAALLQQIQDQSLQQMIQMEVMMQEAERMGIQIGDEMVDQEFDEIRRQFSSEEEFDQVLAEHRYTETELRETLKQEMMIDALLVSITPEVDVSQEELLDFYHQYERQHREQLTMMEDDENSLTEEDMALRELPSFEEMEEELRLFLVQEKVQEQQMVLISELVENSDVEIRI